MNLRILLGVLILILCSSCKNDDEINKIVFRGAYYHGKNKPYKGDTIIIVNDKKGIDSILSFIKSANFKKNVTLKDTNDYEYNSYEMRLYKDNLETDRIKVKSGLYIMYFKHDNKLHDAKKITDFMVKRFLKEYNNSSNLVTVEVDSSFSPQ